jgi:hypothetical protein
MKNNLETLNETLFQTLQDLKENKIEVKKAKAIVEVSNSIVKNVSLQLSAFKLLEGSIELPKAIATEQKSFSKYLTTDGHKLKTQFAKSLGYKDVVAAIGDLGSVKFNAMFKELK